MDARPSRISTHVLDTAGGGPVVGLAVRLERLTEAGVKPIARGLTGADGRLAEWRADEVPPGRYRLVFETGAWFGAAGRETLYPEVVIHFEVAGGESHYHLPLLLAPFGYTTYRGR